MYLGVSIGLNYNIEYFADETEDRQSAEVFAAVGLNMFDFEKIDITSNLRFLPSLSEDERIRVDYDLKIKYKIIKDFYISAGLSFNYDNKTAAVGDQFDYVVNTGFGWKFNE